MNAAERFLALLILRDLTRDEAKDAAIDRALMRQIRNRPPRERVSQTTRVDKSNKKAK